MEINAVHREIPSRIDGYGDTGNKLFEGAFAKLPSGYAAGARIRAAVPNGSSKLAGGVRDAIMASGLKSGMTISFHHHLRNGDYVMNEVIRACAQLGIVDLTIFPTEFFDVHKEIIPYIKSGVVSRVMGCVNGAIGRLISEGGMNPPVVLCGCGGRSRAVVSGDVRIDVAFIAAPTADRGGNISGRGGKSACGSIGYALTDAQYADVVVAVTDNLQSYPISPISIPGVYVDLVAVAGNIGNPAGIASGYMRATGDPMCRLIAKFASKLIEASPYFMDGISFQTGAGDIQLAATAFIKEAMKRRDIRGSFGLGGITGCFVDMMREGLLHKLMDVQSLDLEAVKSISSDPNHIEISADWYANPWNCGAAVNMLDVVILGAAEVDRNFNANVSTDTGGVLLQGIGGHQDAAAGAKLTIIALPLMRGRVPRVVDRVHTVTTPGEVIDAVVTEFGVTINPRRNDLMDAFDDFSCAGGIPLVSMDELCGRAGKMSGPMSPTELTDNVVGVVEWRDGTVIDVIRRPERVE